MPLSLTLDARKVVAASDTVGLRSPEIANNFFLL